MTIRPATPADAPDLVPLFLEFMAYHASLDPGYAPRPDATGIWVPYIAGRLADADCRGWVAVEDDVIVGYVVAMLADYPPVFEVVRHGFVQEICVAGRVRGRGIGRALVDEALAWLRSEGVPQVDVRIDVGNIASNTLFEGRGFAPRTRILRKVLADRD